MARLTGRLAMNPAASDADRVRLAELACKVAEGGYTTPTLNDLIVQAEDVVRNAGRATPTDRGLAQATRDLVKGISQLESNIRDHEHELRIGSGGESQTKLQLIIADLNQDREVLLGLKAQADRLANGRDELDAGDRATVLNHLRSAGQGARPETLIRILGELQLIGR